jgi:NTE family protein
VKVAGSLIQRSRYFFEEDSLDSLYGLNQAGGFLFLEQPFFRRLELSLGVFSQYSWMDHRLGNKILKEESWSHYGVRAVVYVDTLDRVIAPERGIHGVAQLDSSIEEDAKMLGLAKTAAIGYLALTEGLILIPRTEVQSLLWGTAHPVELPALGQAMEIYGYYPQELRGENAALFGLALRGQVGSLPLGLGDEVYFQLAGNTAVLWQNDASENYENFQFFHGGAAGIVVNSLIGELQLSVGMNEEGRWSTYIGLSTTPSFFGDYY